jgi:hypothetical protein
MEQKKFEENVDYVLVPLEEDPDGWGVRFLTGDFVETVIQYKAIGINEVKDHLTFNFDIISTPDKSLTDENEDLQNFSSYVLLSIIESGYKEGWVEFHEVEK